MSEEVKARYEKWAADRGLKQSRGAANPYRLVGKHIGFWNAPRWVDHRRLWIRDGKAACFTSEPYDLYEEDREEIRLLTEELEIFAFIREKDESLWYPGATFLIELWAPWAYLT